jgi:hypothetical protein
VTTVRAILISVITCLAACAGSACYSPNKVIAPDDVLLLTASPETIAANGFSTSRITAKINPVANRVLVVAFSNAGGTLSSNAARTPDANGEASVLLTSETVPKTATVTAEVKEGAVVLASRSIVVTFEPASADSVLRLIPSASEAQADGVSSVELRVEANPAGASRTVSFTTTDGSFVRGATPAQLTLNNVTTGADGVARVQLFAPVTPGTALVTATANGFSASETITFTPAAPDFITLSATPLQISRASENNSTTLTATLSRAIGTVSRNTRVDFAIVNDAGGQSFGRFQSITRSDANGVATAQFVPGTAAPLGLATITAQVPDRPGVLARIKVNITN